MLNAAAARHLRLVAPCATAAWLLSLAAAAAPTVSPSPEPPSFAARAEVVTVDAVVVDGHGNPVTGLTAADFVVTEEGAPQHVQSFEAINLPLAPAEPGEAAPVPRPRVTSNVEAAQRRSRVLAIVFDDLHLSPVTAQRAKAALAGFLEKNVAQGDIVMLSAVGTDLFWSARMPEGRADMLEVLRRLEGRRVPTGAHDVITDYEAMRVHVDGDTTVGDRVARRFRSYQVDFNTQSMNTLSETTRLRVLAGVNEPIVEMRAAQAYVEARQRNTLTLRGMKRAIDSLGSARGRKSLILVSEGFILDPTLGADREAIDAAHRANTAVYFIDARGLAGLSSFMTAEYNQQVDQQDFGATLANDLLDAEGASAVAESTGGFSIRNTNDLLSGLDRATRDSRDYYLLGYTPQNAARDGRFRAIRVTVNRKGVSVRARRGYYAPRDGSEGRQAKTATDDAQAAEALDAPLAISDIPLRTAAYVMETTPNGRARVVLTVDADITRLTFAETNGQLRNTLQLICLVAQRGTSSAQRFDKTIEMTPSAETLERLRASWYPLDRDFELGPGVYQARVMVRDANRRVGTVIHDFEVPELAGLRISTPVLTDVVETPAGQTTAAAAPVARRVFLANRPLFVQFETYGAARDATTGQASVSAGYEIRATDGTVVRSSAPKPIAPAADGRLARLVGIPANALAPGDYELVLQLWDAVAQQARTAHEPFSVKASPTS